MFHTVLNNSGSNTRFWLEGEISDMYGRSILTFLTSPKEISTGTWTYGAVDLVMRSFIYAAGDAGQSAQYFQKLPNGRYRFCLRVRSDGEGDDQLCETYEVEDFLALDLVHPWDKDTVDETRPTLSWALTASAPTADVRLVLAPLAEGRRPAQALAYERPLFIIPQVSPGAVPFPTALPDLERGKCYAWQVEQVDGTRIKERSEPWGFCVRLTLPPPVNKYVRLDRQEPGTVYEVTDGRVFFRYDESYDSRSMTCAVYGPARKHIEPVTLNEGGTKATANARNVGPNLFELDLQPYHLKRGMYELVVTDEMGRTRTLILKIAR